MAAANTASNKCFCTWHALTVCTHIRGFSFSVARAIKHLPVDDDTIEKGTTAGFYLIRSSIIVCLPPVPPPSRRIHQLIDTNPTSIANNFPLPFDIIARQLFMSTTNIPLFSLPNPITPFDFFSNKEKIIADVVVVLHDSTVFFNWLIQYPAVAHDARHKRLLKNPDVHGKIESSRSKVLCIYATRGNYNVAQTCVWQESTASTTTTTTTTTCRRRASGRRWRT